MNTTPMIVVLAVYLFALALIAVRSAFKVKGIPDFFVARKGARALAVAGSLVATILGGSAVIGAIDAGPTLGGAAAWFMLTGALGLLALLPLIRRARRFGKFTLPDMIENLYGTGPRVVAGVVIPVAWTGIVAAQMIASAKLLQNFTSLGYTESACIAAGVLILYTMAGGQVSILRTDFFQAVLILAGLLTIGVFVAVSLLGVDTGGYLVLRSHGAIQTPGFPFNENFSPLDLFILIVTYGTTFTVGPDMFSRIFCARDDRSAKAAVLVAVGVLVPVSFLIGYLAAFGTTLGNVQGTRIMEIASAVVPSALLPLIAVSLMSVVLSSADTTLLSSSVIVCELISRFPPKKLEGLTPNFRTSCGVDWREMSLSKARLVIFANGMLALLLALHFTDIISTLLLALAVYAGAFTMPVLLGLLGMRVRPVFVNAAIVAGGAISLAGKLSQSFWGGDAGDILTIAAFVVNAVILYAGRMPRADKSLR